MRTNSAGTHIRKELGLNDDLHTEILLPPVKRVKPGAR